MQFELEIDANDILKEINEMDKFSKKLDNFKIKLLNRMANTALEIIRENCPEDTGELINSIQKSEIFEDMIEVFTDSAYARYVEFGTGIVGQQAPHPEAGTFSWQYDINGHGQAGWKYQDKNGEWHWTKGQTGSQFMYKAYQYLDTNYMQIAEQVLKEEGLI